MKGSGSSAALLTLCQYPFRSDVESPPKEDTAATDYGTRLHAALEAYAAFAVSRMPGKTLQLQVPPDLSEDFDAGKAWIDDNHSQGWLIEKAYALDVVTGKARELPSNGQRDYSQKTATELPGTLDLVQTQTAFVHVYDWTTARDYSYKWPQLKLYTAMAQRAMGRRGVGLATMLAIRDGVLTEETQSYLQDDLDKCVADLQFAAAMIPGSLPSMGSHCVKGYCGMIASCPEMLRIHGTALESSSVGAKLAEHPKFRLSLAIDGPEHAAWMVNAVDAVEVGLKKIQANLKAYADSTGGIPMGDELVYAAKEQTREAAILDEESMGFLLSRQALGAVEIKSTLPWTALDKAVGKAKGKEIREQLRKMGKISSNTFQVYDVRKKDKAKS